MQARVRPPERIERETYAIARAEFDPVSEMESDLVLDREVLDLRPNAEVRVVLERKTDEISYRIFGGFLQVALFLGGELELAANRQYKEYSSLCWHL